MIGQAPISAALPVMRNMASWPKVWASFFTEVWQALNYGWHWPVVTVTSAYTVKLTDAVILVNGNITVTLPDVTKVGDKRITVKVINAGGGTRTVDGGGVNIDGAATVSTTTQYTSWDFVNDGANYFIV